MRARKDSETCGTAVWLRAFEWEFTKQVRPIPESYEKSARFGCNCWDVPRIAMKFQVRLKFGQEL